MNVARILQYLLEAVRHAQRACARTSAHGRSCSRSFRDAAGDSEGCLVSCSPITPMPWTVEKTAAGHPLISGGGGTVAVLDVSAVAGTPEADKINAAHIVKCVNAHDDLVAALVRIRGLIAEDAGLAHLIAREVLIKVRT